MIIRDLCNNKRSNISVIKVSEGAKKGCGVKNKFQEIMAEIFSDLVKGWEVEQTPNKINPKKSKPRHIIKLLKVKTKKKILKGEREWHNTCPVRNTKSGGFCLFFYWSIVNIWCCVSFWCRAKWFSYTYIYILFFIFFSIIVYYKILNIVPCAIE